MDIKTINKCMKLSKSLLGSQILFIILMINVIILSSCKKDDSDKQNIIGPVTFSENTVFIENTTWQNQIIDIDTVNGVFTFSSNPGLSVGDIMISEDGEGWIRKITDVHGSSGNYILNTEFASLCDAIESVSATKTYSISPGKNSFWKPYDENVTINQDFKSDNNSNLYLNINWIAYDKDGNLNTTDDQITLNGYYGMSSEIIAGIKIENYNLEELSLNYSIVESASVSVSTQLSLELFKQEKRLARYNNLPPFLLFPGCIVTPIIEIYGGVEITNVGEIGVEIEKSKDYTAGIIYRNGSWNTTKTINENETSIEPIISNTLSAKAYLKPKLIFKINGVISPKLEAELNNQIESIYSQSGLEWEISKGFTMGVGIEMKIFNKTMLDFSANFFDIKGIIAKGSITNLLPIADFYASPTISNTGQYIQFTDQSYNNPSSWLWNFGDGNTSSQHNPTHIYTSEGSYTVSLKVSNASGSDTKEKLNYITIDNEIPVGLIAYYPLDGNANDESGNGNNGTIMGGVISSSDRHGNEGKAMQFDGINGFIEVPNSTSLQSPQSALSITAWIWIDGYNGLKAAGIVNKTNTSSYGQYGLTYHEWNNPSRINFYINQGNVGFPASVSLGLSQWHFIASIYDGSKMTIYVDGVKLGDKPYKGFIDQDSNPITIGLDSPGSKEYLKGKLDDIRIFNHPLSEGDVLSLYKE